MKKKKRLQSKKVGGDEHKNIVFFCFNRVVVLHRYNEREINSIVRVRQEIVLFQQLNQFLAKLITRRGCLGDAGKVNQSFNRHGQLAGRDVSLDYVL